VKLPTQLEIPLDGYYLKIEDNSRGRKKYRLISTKCRDNLYLEYDVEEDRYIPEKIEYSRDDGSLKVIAERIRRKLNVDIPEEKFDISIPRDAAQIVY